MDQAAWKRCEHEYAKAGALDEKRGALDALALQIAAAVDAAAERQVYVKTGDAATSAGWESLRAGDVEGGEKARLRAAEQYLAAGEEKSAILEELDAGIRDAAEKREIEMRMARARKREEEAAFEKKRVAEEDVRRKLDERRRKEEEDKVKEEEQAKRKREENEKRQQEEDEKRRIEDEEREQRQAEEARKAALLNLKIADEKFSEARTKIVEKDFIGAQAARQAATDAYVKAGEDRYGELKMLDADIDEAIRKRDEAEFYDLARKKAFEQATLAQVGTARVLEGTVGVLEDSAGSQTACVKHACMHARTHAYKHRCAGGRLLMGRCRLGRPVGKRQKMPPKHVPLLNSKRPVAGGKRRKVGKWQQQLEAGRQSAIAATGSLTCRRCRAWCSGSHRPRPAGLLRRIRMTQTVRGGLVSAGCFFLSTAPGGPPF